jgi:Flp pilus assembly protein TadG
MSVKTKLEHGGLQNAAHTKSSRNFLRGLRQDHGTSVLEMALLTPLLLLLLLGIIEVGRYAELGILVANAARAGAQYGAQNQTTAADPTGMQNAAVNDAQGAITTSQVTAVELCGCSASTLGSACPVPSACATPLYPITYVQVRTQGTYNSLFHYPGIPTSLTVSGAAQMRVVH